MRIVGLLGGMSFEGSATYYRLINEAVRDRLGGLNSADTVMRSVNFDTVVAMQKAGRWHDAGACLAEAARGLERAGAECVLICAVTMHLVADAVSEAIGIPFIHIVDETARRLVGAACRRPLLIATRYTMEHGFYQQRMAGHGIDPSSIKAMTNATGRALILGVSPELRRRERELAPQTRTVPVRLPRDFAGCIRKGGNWSSRRGPYSQRL